MTRRYRESSPHTRTPARPERLQKRTHQREAAIERFGELLPCVCDSCGALLGLAEPGQALRCLDCAVWVEPVEDLTAIAGVAE
jgi:hypothetical protein